MSRKVRGSLVDLGSPARPPSKPARQRVHRPRSVPPPSTRRPLGLLGFAQVVVGGYDAAVAPGWPLAATAQRQPLPAQRHRHADLRGSAATRPPPDEAAEEFGGLVPPSQTTRRRATASAGSPSSSGCRMSCSVGGMSPPGRRKDVNPMMILQLRASAEARVCPSCGVGIPEEGGHGSGALNDGLFCSLTCYARFWYKDPKDDEL